MDKILISILILASFGIGFVWYWKPQPAYTYVPDTSVLRRLIFWRYIWYAGIVLTIGGIVVNILTYQLPTELTVWAGLLLWIPTHLKLRRMLNRLGKVRAGSSQALPFDAVR